MRSSARCRIEPSDGMQGPHEGKRGVAIGRAVAAAGIALAMAACIALAGCGGSHSSSSSGNASGSTSTDAAQAASTTDAAAAGQQAPQYVVTIDGATVGQDYEGKSCIIVSYTFTNNGDDATSPAAAVINKAFQNSVELTNAIATDIDNDGYLKEIKTGGTVSYQQAYELEDQSEVTVESSKLISFDDSLLATATFSVA